MSLYDLLSSHPEFTHIRPQTVAGVAPDDILTVLQLVGGAAVVGEPFIHLVHPAGFRSHVKFIQVVDALDIVAVVHGRPAVFDLDVRGLTDLVQHLEHCIPLREADPCLGEDRSVSGDEGCLFLVQIIGVVQNGVADDGDCADMILLTGGNDGVVLQLPDDTGCPDHRRYWFSA